MKKNYYRFQFVCKLVCIIQISLTLYHYVLSVFFLVCLSLTWMSGPNVTKTPSMYADPSNEGYNCNKTWLLLPIYYRTDI